MIFHVLTLFPEMIKEATSHSVLGRGIKTGLISVCPTNIRDFSHDKHKHVDDYPYGGGNGMVMMPEPVYDAYMYVKEKCAPGTRVVYMTPQGKTFNQEIARELSCENEIIILCGHYEGIDERVIDEIVTDEISLGEFILTGGEIAAVAVIDAVSRLIPGVLGNELSPDDESFSNGLLEYPQYTRPPEFKGKAVPEILLSGHHENIRLWRKEQSIVRTLEKRPELLKKASLDEESKKILDKLKNNNCN